MADKIIELLNSKDKMRELGKNGKEFSKQFISKNVSILWKKLIEGEEEDG